MKLLLFLGVICLTPLVGYTQNETEKYLSTDKVSNQIKFTSISIHSQSTASYVTTIKSACTLIPAKNIKRIAISSLLYLEASSQRNISLLLDQNRFYLDGRLTQYTPGIISNHEFNYRESFLNGTPAMFESKYLFGT